jgi:hypothetical protein
VNQYVKGSPESLGPKWLTGNYHRPSSLVWSDEDTLCGGCGDPFPWWRAPECRRHQGDQGSMASAYVASLCGESSGDLGRYLVTGKQYTSMSASTT